MWCGVKLYEITDPAYASPPGYGNAWTQYLESIVLGWIPSNSAKLSFRASYDFWNSLDRLHVEYRSGAGAWTHLATFTGTDFSGAVHEYIIPGASLPAGTLQFRFVVTTNVALSDEDGFNTNGAVILDEIYVTNTTTTNVVLASTFESDPNGSTSTADWTGTTPAPFGNYGGLVSGASVVQAGTPNTTAMWSFFNGSAETYACGGYPGQPALPKTGKPGSLHTSDYLLNEVRSPMIYLDWDKNGQPVDPNYDSVTAEFDAYLDLPQASDVLMTFRHRFVVGGEPTPWNTRGGGYYSDTPGWMHISPADFGGFTIPANATHVQIGIIVVDAAYQTGATGQCHTHAPLIDNVSVHRLYRPYFVTNTNDSGLGSLRQAIVSANGNSDQNAILFDVPGDGPHVIAPESPLPQITHPVWMDGFSQAGSVPNLYPTLPSTATMKIALDGTWTGPGAHGLDFASTSYSVVRGLAIGGFEGAGIRSQATSSIVTGCFVGMDAAGTTPLANGVGIDVLNMQMSIGGPANEERMMIAGNAGDGIRVHAGSGPIFNCIIGLDVTGNPMWNGGAGIRVLGGSTCQIGQPTWGPCVGQYTDQMLLAYNAGGGIIVEPGASGVNIYQAAFFPGIGMNIDLGGDGPTANDALDADSGANGLQNHPVLTAADGTTITGSMDGTPNELHRIEFFIGADCYSPVKYLGYQEVTTDGSGHAAISFTCAPIPPAVFVTATAMDASYNTSEFAPCIESMNTPPGDPLVTLYESINGPVRATVQFNAVGTAGNTFISPTTPPAGLPSGWDVGSNPTYWDITTTAIHNGAQVSLVYDENNIPGPESMLHLFHWTGAEWEDITHTVDLDNNRVGGPVDSFSPFVLAVPLGATGVGDGPTVFALHPNVPNPFNPQTAITYDVPAGGVDVEIAIFDVAGRRVRTLVDEHRAAGTHSTRWNGEDQHGGRVASGVYFYRMRAGAFVETRKMVLLK
jgi:hypothetical protein